MRMSQTLFSDILAVAQRVITQHRVNLDNHRRVIVAEGKAKDAEKRLRWDLFYACNKIERANMNADFAERAYADGLNDNHIDTALKAVIRKLENK